MLSSLETDLNPSAAIEHLQVLIFMSFYLDGLYIVWIMKDGRKESIT